MNNALAWNIHRAFKKSSLRRLKNLIKLHDISLVVLLEPMAEASRQQVFALVCILKCLTNKIWILWRKPFHLHMSHYYEQFLYLRVLHDDWSWSLKLLLYMLKVCQQSIKCNGNPYA
ncbi:hypothetical protein ACH5RR_040934 [Cinchona calisaya]|uniref:Uncharacterized protein n=1 Tax=Cinchona calisaya TaxID=153742 RepID=A0ABD2XV54_9GENT